MEIGVLGAGQLGRMLALAGYQLGMRFVFIDPTPDAPASRIAPQLVAAYDDPGALARLGQCDRVTYEFENVPLYAVREIERTHTVSPSSAALAATQDRLTEKTFLRELGVATCDFVAVENRAELEAAAASLGFPLVLKTRRLGYDGKGQALLRSRNELAQGLNILKRGPAIAEQWVEFERELSIVSVRSQAGEVNHYPLIENQHRSGILYRSLAPAPGANQLLQQQAESAAEALLSELDYVGVVTIEFFQQADRLIANEFAPRVHNSGHLTIEGAKTSQFENHLRAISGLPLGSTEIPLPTAMLNLVGTLPDLEPLYQLGDCHVHLYDKTPRPGRKLGHVTLRANSDAELAGNLSRAENIVGHFDA